MRYKIEKKLGRLGKEKICMYIKIRDTREGDIFQAKIPKDTEEELVDNIGGDEFQLSIEEIIDNFPEAIISKLREKDFIE